MMKRNKRIMTWHRSTYSGSCGGNCVEVGAGTGRVLVRDTKQGHLGNGGTMLSVTSGAWRVFTASLK